MCPDTNILLCTIDQLGRVQIIWLLVAYVVVRLIGFLIWSKFFYQKERRLFKNLKRKVYFLKFPDSQHDLQTETRLIQKNGFFKADSDVKNYSDNLLHSIEEKAAIVISYSPTYNGYQRLIDSLQPKKIPLVILAKSDSSNRILPEHTAIFDQYPYHQVCNGTSRLLTSLFSICAITPL